MNSEIELERCKNRLFDSSRTTDAIFELQGQINVYHAEFIRALRRAEKAEARVKELEDLIPSERDVLIKAKAQFPAGVSVGEVVTAIIEKVGMVGMIHKHLGYYLAESKEQS
jgi:hypothetical protein